MYVWEDNNPTQVVRDCGNIEDVCSKHLGVFVKLCPGRNQQLVADEPVEFDGEITAWSSGNLPTILQESVEYIYLKWMKASTLEDVNIQPTGSWITRIFTDSTCPKISRALVWRWQSAWIVLQSWGRRWTTLACKKTRTICWHLYTAKVVYVCDILCFGHWWHVALNLYAWSSVIQYTTKNFVCKSPLQWCVYGNIWTCYILDEDSLYDWGKKERKKKKKKPRL